MLKKSSILCSCGSLHLLTPRQISSVHSPTSAGRPRQHQSPSLQCKRFVHVKSSQPVNPDEDISWPITPTFTPYELFKQERTAPYSKARFYHLVKIYHPDRPCNDHPLCKDISN